MYANLYCKLFIDADMDMLAFVNMVRQFSNGEIIHGRYINNHYCEICVNKNVTFDETLRRQKGDGFLYARYFLDIEPTTLTEQSSYIGFLSQFLTCFWNEGYYAVAACDFEDDLPNKGGYQP